MNSPTAVENALRGIPLDGQLTKRQRVACSLSFLYNENPAVAGFNKVFADTQKTNER